MKPKNNYFTWTVLIVGLFAILLSSCKKEDKSESNTLKDIDGNVYHYVTIGTQIWMVENLKTTKYRNGEEIPNITNGNEWGKQRIGACCDYQNAPSFSMTYGKLYNWYAVKDNRNIAPVGWHIPTDAEWNTLITYLEGENVAGGKLKEQGTAHWKDPNSNSTNINSGFEALPGGQRRSNLGLFEGMSLYGYWWSATEENPIPGIEMGIAWYRTLYHSYSSIERDDDEKLNGLSVRCLKDI